jgi:transcription antitermination factor NusG
MGVIDLIKFGEPAMPAKVPDVEIGRLMSRASADGVIRLPQPRSRHTRGIRPGARVMITAGALSGFDAIHIEMTSDERARVLLDVLGAPRRVEIAAGWLRV